MNVREGLVKVVIERQATKDYVAVNEVAEVEGFVFANQLSGVKSTRSLDLQVRRNEVDALKVHLISSYIRRATPNMIAMNPNCAYNNCKAVCRGSTQRFLGFKA